MSSYYRTLQKRSLKRKGWSRQTERLEMGMDGRPFVKKLKPGEGDVMTPQGDPVGKRWPTEWGFGPKRQSA